MDEYKPSKPNREALQGFGQRLQWSRWHRALRQLDLAELSGVSKATIAALESDHRLPNIKSICRLSAALSVELVWLAFGEGESNLPEGKPLYQPPEPYNKRNKVSPEERAERKLINQTAWRIAQHKGTSFKAERAKLRAEREEAANLAEARERYGFDFPV